MCRALEADQGIYSICYEICNEFESQRTRTQHLTQRSTSMPNPKTQTNAVKVLLHLDKVVAH